MSAGSRRLAPVQCTGIRLYLSRPFERRCTRRAAAKHGFKFCGECAPKPAKCGTTQGDTYRYHRNDCSGCRFDCCQDRALCVAGRCHEFDAAGELKAVTS